MGRVETFLGTAVFNFIFTPIVFFFLLFICRAIFFTMLEMVRPARVVAYRAVFMNDLTASLAYAYLIFPLAAKLSMIAPGHRSSPASIGQLPLPLRVILYFVLADFGYYWVHRLIHTQYLWRVHKWHHSPTYLKCHRDSTHRWMTRRAQVMERDEKLPGFPGCRGSALWAMI